MKLFNPLPQARLLDEPQSAFEPQALAAVREFFEPDVSRNVGQFGFKGEALSVYLAQPIGLGLNTNDKLGQRPDGLTANRRAVGP